MKMKKLCALALCSCMILGVFTACNSEDDESTDITVISSESVTTDTSAPAETSESTEATESTEETVPSETTEQGEPMEITDQTKVNTYISNFAEVFFGDFERDTASVKTILNFIHIHLKINSRNSISYENKGDLSYESFTMDTAQSNCTKYFGIRLNEDDCRDLPLPPTTSDAYAQGPFYDNGKFYYPAADGESYNLIGVVDNMYSNSDGTITFAFTIYEIDLDTYSSLDANGMKAYYKLTSSQAANDITLSRVTGGTATVSATQSGGYSLISYHPDKQ